MNSLNWALLESEMITFLKLRNLQFVRLSAFLYICRSFSKSLIWKELKLNGLFF